jgi:hypothetical protein
MISSMVQRIRWMAVGGLVTLLVVGAGAFAAVRVAPGRLGDFFFGPRMVRSEAVLLIDGQLKDFRIDRGKLKSLPRNGTVELRELDGSTQLVPVSPTAQVTINGRPVLLSALKRGMVVTTIREGSDPATQVSVDGPRIRAVR